MNPPANTPAPGSSPGSSAPRENPGHPDASRPAGASHTPPAPVRLVAVDLDGTLLQRDQTILDADTDAIRAVIAAGVKVVIASARPPRIARDYYDQLQLDTPQINYNGVLVQTPGSPTPLLHRPLDPEVALRVVRFARELEPAVVVDLEVHDRWFTDAVHPNLRTQTSLRFEPDRLAPLETLFDEPVTKVMLLAATPRIRRLRDAITQRFPDDVKIVTSDRHLLQLIHPQADKAAGLALVAERLGIAQHETLAIGDAPNDVGMLRWAGTGVAVGDGWDEAKSAADLTGPPHREAAVAWALRRFVLPQR